MKYICPVCGEKLKYGRPVCPRCSSPMTWNPKKKKRHGFLKFLLVTAIILVVLSLLWFSFGNLMTLYIHTNNVAAEINSGSFELDDAGNSAYDELPDYVKEMLGDALEEEEQNGPIMEAVMPYVEAKRTAIHGFFGGSTVEYTITAPDLEAWVTSLDPTAVTSSEQMLSELLEYIPNAPKRKQTVTVEYFRDGLFGWQGNYRTPEFADALSGGLNSAYNLLYRQMLEELEEYLG